MVFARSLNHLLIESDCPPYVDMEDEQAWTNARGTKRHPIFEHLCRLQSECWLTEDRNKIVGYARSIFPDEVC